VDFLETYGGIFEEASSRVFSLYDGGIRGEPADVIGAQGQNGLAISPELGRDPTFVDAADGLKIGVAER